jgi:hypothetical protein
MTGEFVNIGVALYAPKAKYISGLFNTKYGRLAGMFGEIKGDYYRELMRYIEKRFKELGKRLNNELLFPEAPADIYQIAKSILPPDDSSLQWSEPGCGQTENPEKTLEYLFERMVSHYEKEGQHTMRNDNDVWRVFKKEFEKRHVLNRLRSKQIKTQNYDYEFKQAWKNENWHVYEPVSFDLVEPESILEKANKWLGRATTLRDSQDAFILHMLLGEPSIEKNRSAFEKAENILKKIPGEKELVYERNAEEFSEELATEMTTHNLPTILSK